MTEAEWLAITDPWPVLESLRGNSSERKLRLFVVACCYRVWQWMSDARSRAGIETAERYAEGLVGEGELEGARKGTEGAGASVMGMGWHIYLSARAAHFSVEQRAAVFVRAAHEVVNAHWNHAQDTFSCSGSSAPAVEAKHQERSHQVAFLRDIFGNPCRPVAVGPSWLS